MSEKRKIKIDELIEGIPFGRFHYRMMVLSGLATMSDALETNILSFISLCAGADWGLTNTEIAALTSAIFAGEMLGSMFWGPVSDRYGRRFVFIAHVCVMVLFGILSGLSPNYATLITFRMMVGFAIGGCTVPYDLQAELTPSKVRGRVMGVNSIFWTIGALIVSGLAAAVLERDDASTWRILVYLTTIPMVIALVFGIWLLPESPRWLLTKGRREEAEQILKDAAIFNGTPITFSFELILEDDDSTKGVELIEQGKKSDSSPAPPYNPQNDHGNDLISELKAILSPNRRHVTLPGWTIWFCFGFAYYGIVLFVARIFQDSDDDGELQCSFDYTSIFINAAMENIGTLVVLTCVDWLGRVNLQTGLYSSAAFGAFWMGMHGKKGFQTGFILFVSSLARASVSGASGVSWIHAPELYETKYRGIGHSTNYFVARVGAMICPFLVDSSADFVAIGTTLSLICIVAAGASRFLPETANKELDLVGNSCRNPIAKESFKKASESDAPQNKLIDQQVVSSSS